MQSLRRARQVDGMDTRFEAARAIVRSAGALARQRYELARNVSRADMERFRTASSEAVEQAIVAEIRAQFPRDTAYGEEFGGDIGDPLWVIDPIDGVVNFGRGIPYFCISVAVVSAGVTEIGIVYDVIADELFEARRGHGAAVNGRPLQCSEVTDPRRSCIGLGFAHRTPIADYAETVGRLMAAGIDYRRLSAAALMLAHVADGRLDGFFEARLHSWDVLAGLLLCEEAGARVSDFRPAQRLRSGGPALACAPGLWDCINEMLLVAEHA